MRVAFVLATLAPIVGHGLAALADGIGDGASCDVSTVSVTVTAPPQTVTVTALSSHQLATTTITTHSTSTGIVTVTQISSATEEPACRAWPPHQYQYYTHPSGVTHWRCDHSPAGTGPAISLTTTIRVVPSVPLSSVNSESAAVSSTTSRSSSFQLGASLTRTETGSFTAPTSMLSIPHFVSTQQGPIHLTYVGGPILRSSKWELQTPNPSSSFRSQQYSKSSVQSSVSDLTGSSLLSGLTSAQQPKPTHAVSSLSSELLLSGLMPSSAAGLPPTNITSAGATATFRLTSTSKIILTVSSNKYTKSNFNGIGSTGWNSTSFPAVRPSDGSGISYVPFVSSSLRVGSGGSATTFSMAPTAPVVYPTSSPAVVPVQSFWPSYTPRNMSSISRGSGLTSDTLSSYISSTTIVSQNATFSTSAQSSQTTRPAARPSVCGESGNFTLTWDDLPSFRATDPAAGDFPLLSNPYHHFFLANGFVYYGPSMITADAWTPTSQPYMAIFVPENSDAPTSNPYAGIPKLGEITAGPRMNMPIFWFDAFSANVGCDDGGLNDCEMTITGYKYNNATHGEVIAATQKTSIPKCPTYANCDLKFVQLDGAFRGLSGIQFEGTANGVANRTFALDNLALGWSDNTCQAGLARLRQKKRSI